MTQTNVRLKLTGEGDLASFFIYTDGLKETIATLEKSDKYVRLAVSSALNKSASPILAKARSLASRIQDDGTFASSLWTEVRPANMRLLLRSTGDPAAGVKEFAKRGAVTVTAKNTKLARARRLARSGVGVPAGNPPRVMIPAVNDKAEMVAQNISQMIDDIYSGEFSHG